MANSPNGRRFRFIHFGIDITGGSEVEGYNVADFFDCDIRNATDAQLTAAYKGPDSDGIEVRWTTGEEQARVQDNAAAPHHGGHVFLDVDTARDWLAQETRMARQRQDAQIAPVACDAPQSGLAESQPALTPAERRHCLNALHLSMRALADILRVDESTVRRWLRDAAAPPDVDAWLARRAAGMEADPPPQLATPRGPGRPVGVG